LEPSAKTPNCPSSSRSTEIIVLEIQKTFDFFRATAGGEHIERIYVAGGSSQVPDWWKLSVRSFQFPSMC